MVGIPQRHDAAIAADRRAAVRALLLAPLMTPRSHPEVFPLVRRHAEWLAPQFAQVLGYRLVVEAGFARLHKAGLGVGSGHRLLRGSGTPFSPRCYAYLVLALSVLVTAPEQLLLSELVIRIRTAASEAGVHVREPNKAHERRALVAALRKLLDWHVLSENDGVVAAYADDENSEALLSIDQEIARNIVTGPVGQSRTADELIERAAAPGFGGVRHYVRRRLVEMPVVYLDDLRAEERAWLRHRQRREQLQVEELFGMDMEIRAEGVALVDPEDELSAVKFPGTGTRAQASLLLVERLAARRRPVMPGSPAGRSLTIGVPVTDEDIDTALRDLVERHRTHWSAEYVDNPAKLRADVVALLCRMHLLAPAAPTRADLDTTDAGNDRVAIEVGGARGSSGPWVLLAAAARYSVIEKKAGR